MKKIIIYFLTLLFLGTTLLNAAEKDESPTSLQKDPHHSLTPMPHALPSSKLPLYDMLGSLVGSVKESAKSPEYPDRSEIFEPDSHTPSPQRQNSRQQANSLSISPLTPQSIFPIGMDPNDKPGTSVISIQGSPTPSPQVTPESQKKVEGRPESQSFDRDGEKAWFAAFGKKANTSGTQLPADSATDSFLGLTGDQSTISTASNTGNNSTETTPTAGAKATPSGTPPTELPAIAQATTRATVVAVGAAVCTTASKKDLHVNVASPKGKPLLTQPVVEQKKPAPLDVDSPVTNRLDDLSNRSRKSAVLGEVENSQKRDNLEIPEEIGCCGRKKYQAANPKEAQSTVPPTPTSPRQIMAEQEADKTIAHTQRPWYKKWRCC